tara:strand:- start:384 stop:515 length:132 start_codon:yes stop_codon:yes gene_type:complete
MFSQKKKSCEDEKALSDQLFDVLKTAPGTRQKYFFGLCRFPVK